MVRCKPALNAALGRSEFFVNWIRAWIRASDVRGGRNNRRQGQRTSDPRDASDDHDVICIDERHDLVPQNIPALIALAACPR